MTIKLAATPPPTEGKAVVYEINLPSELAAGASITGNIKAQNIGAVEDTIRILITTQWDGAQYQGSGLVPVNSLLTVTIGSGVITMPSLDAVIKIEAQHLEGTAYVTDDTKSH